MKNVLFCLLACVALLGCSKEEGPTSAYTELQQKALLVFNGVWADVQFSNLGNYPGAELQPDPDKLIFGTQYKEPVEVTKDDYMYGETLLFSAFGEVVYHSEGYEDVPCYYWVSKNADELRLYEVANNRLYKKFGLTIKSESEMRLQSPNITLPYIFVKQ